MMSEDYKDLPGSENPPVDNVRYEAIEFEKAVKAYIENQTGKLPKAYLPCVINASAPVHPNHHKLSRTLILDSHLPHTNVSLRFSPASPHCGFGY